MIASVRAFPVRHCRCAAPSHSSMLEPACRFPGSGDARGPMALTSANPELLQAYVSFSHCSSPILATLHATTAAPGCRHASLAGIPTLFRHPPDRRETPKRRVWLAPSPATTLPATLLFSKLLHQSSFRFRVWPSFVARAPYLRRAEGSETACS